MGKKPDFIDQQIVNALSLVPDEGRKSLVNSMQRQINRKQKRISGLQKKNAKYLARLDELRPQLEDNNQVVVAPTEKRGLVSYQEYDGQTGLV